MEEKLVQILLEFEKLDSHIIIFNQIIRNETIFNFFRNLKSEKRILKNISIVGKRRDNSLFFDTGKNTVSLFFDLTFSRIFEWKLTRIEFFDTNIETFESVGYPLNGVSFIDRDELTNIQNFINNENHYRSCVTKQELDREEIKLGIFETFFGSIDLERKNKEKDIFIINNALPGDENIFKEEIKDIDEDNKEEYVVPKNHKLILVCSKTDNVKKNLKVSKMGNDENLFKNWEFKIHNTPMNEEDFIKEIEDFLIKNQIQINNKEKENTKINQEITKLNFDLQDIKNLNKKHQEEFDSWSKTKFEWEEKESILKEYIEINKKLKKKNNKDLNKRLSNIENEYNQIISELQSKTEENTNQTIDYKKVLESIFEEINNNIDNKRKIILENNNKSSDIKQILEKKSRLFENKQKEIFELQEQHKKYENLKKTKKEFFTEKTKSKFCFYKIENNIKSSVNKHNQNNNVSLSIRPFEENFEYLNASINNPGLITKMKRYKYSIINSINGYVRNPFMLSSLFRPHFLKNNIQLEETIKSKWDLNERQIESVKGMISTNDTFYLQGPPGTGKTQTICATMQHYVEKDSNVLITSSTHEAINNCLERFDEKNNDNPNIIIYKKSKTTETEDEERNKFSTKNLYKNFLAKIENKIKQSNANSDKFLEYKIKIKKLTQNTNKHYIPIKLWYSIYTPDLFDKNTLVIDLNKKIDSLFKNTRYEEFSENFYYAEHIFERENSIQITFDEKEIIEFIRKVSQNYKIMFFDFKEILKFLEQNTKPNENSKIIELLKIYKENKKPTDPIIESKARESFNKFIDENDLINVLGFTTSSDTKLNISNQDTNRDIWFDYPIDTIIMDEVSKSSTPEILSRINISHKFIMCGDYKQLPPVTDFKDDESFLEEIFENDDEQKISIEWGVNTSKEFVDKVNELFITPFFKNQISKIKKINVTRNKNFNFLNQQYRFNSTIQGLVNLFYKGEEELKTIRKDNEFENYKFLNDDKNKIFYIDTSCLANSYCNLIGKAESDSFDQKEVLCIKEFEKYKEPLDSLFNQYNAYIDIKIVKMLVEKNSPESLKDKIGIICLTVSQRKIVKFLLEESELKKLNIKVNTIDNFQGREKEIIIVDFVRAKNRFVKNNKIEKLDKRNLDFLVEEERINVAASRTKNMLFLVGAFDYYHQIESTFKRRRLLIEYILWGENQRPNTKWLEGKTIYDEKEF
ncbi:AAA domain-containing protein [Mycoplasmopsis hyopharyngis]|uniref:AAA domain-containing protein n=1 Tax=Mycoplasmopsis hyopharyngis TaxID=29558 RepID=UPI0038732218